MPTLLTPTQVFDAVRQSDDRLDTPRERRRESYQEYVGRYGYEDDGVRRPVNLIAKAVNTFVPYLAGRSPLHKVTSDSLMFRGDALKTSLALDVLSRKLNRVRISRLALLDAFLSPMAIVRCGTRAGEEIYTARGKTINVGQPYIMRVDWDDWIFDPAARCRDEAVFEGHYYRIPRAEALDSGIFRGKEDIIESIPSIGDGRCGFRRQERHEDLSRQSPTETGDFDLVDTIELMDLVFYDDYQPVKVTLPANEDCCDDFLRVVELDAPDRGPYYSLEFYPIPNQPFGVPPVAFWRENAEHFSSLLNKAVDEIIKAKKIIFARRSAEDEAETARDAEDSEVVIVDDPSAIATQELGGVVRDLVPIVGQFQAWFDYVAHNPSLLAGDQGETDKVGIYEGQQAGAMTIVNDYMRQHEEFEAEISRDLGWRLMKDPFIVLPLTRRIPGGEFVEITFSADQLSADFEDLVFKLKPRSMLLQDQNLRARRLIELMQGCVQAAEAEMVTQGRFNASKAMEILGNEFDIDELDELMRDPIVAAKMAELYAVAQPTGPGTPSGPSDAKPGANQRAFGGGTSDKQTTPGGARASARPTAGAY